MKRIYKSLIFGSTAIVGLCPTMSLLSSCSKSFDKFVNEIKNDILSEFSWIRQFYRCTFNNREFCHELYKRVTKMGYSVTREWDDKNNCPLPAKDSEGKSHYCPYDKKDPSTNTCYGYDMYFDIPSNIEGDYPVLALQAHTDMVCTFDHQKIEKYNWAKGIEVVTEGDLMHSKNNLTTLGADDATGIATILALAKHKDNFRHGPIRCFFTVDEEDGDSGAKFMPTEWLKDVSYFLNIDGEETNKNWAASAGLAQTGIWVNSTKPTADGKEYRVTINGLPGGHSGLEIMDNHMNPIVTMGKVLDALTRKSGITSVRLVQSYEDGKQNKSPGSSAIATGIVFAFQVETTGLISDDDIKQVVKEAVTDAHKDYQQDNPNDKAQVTFEKVTTPRAEGIDVDTTTKLVKVLTNYNFKEDGLRIHGYEKYPESEYPNAAKTGCSIGAVRVGDNVTTKDTNKLYIELMGRSHDTDEIDKYKKDGEIIQKIKAIFDATPFEATVIFTASPWKFEENNKLRKVLHEAADHYEHEWVDKVSLGWQEISEFYVKNDKIHYSIIGPQIDRSHTVNETLHISTLVPMIKMILYTAEHLEPL